MSRRPAVSWLPPSICSSSPTTRFPPRPIPVQAPRSRVRGSWVVRCPRRRPRARRPSPTSRAWCSCRAGGSWRWARVGGRERERGALIEVAAALMGGAAHPVDLAPLYARLRRELPVLNLEGAAVCGDRLRLLQRGGAAGENVVVELVLADVLACLEAGRPVAAEPVGFTRVALGTLRGVPLGFTDASPLAGGRLVFTAAAEATDDPADGAAAGSVVGAGTWAASSRGSRSWTARGSSRACTPRRPAATSGCCASPTRTIRASTRRCWQAACAPRPARSPRY